VIQFHPICIDPSLAFIIQALSDLIRSEFFNVV
jgi:hypothetical protein